MFNKKKPAVKPELPKEYVWALEIDDQDHEFKCLVTETEVITYEDGVEQARIPVADPTCEEGVLQIDCETKLFNDMVPFQLERYIPYIKLDRWLMSDTTRDDRLEQQITIYQRQSKQETAIGIAMLLAVAIARVVTGEIGDWALIMVGGIFFLVSAAYRMVRLRNELTALNEAKKELETEEAEMKAYLEDKAPVFHKSEEA